MREMENCKREYGIMGDIQNCGRNGIVRKTGNCGIYRELWKRTEFEKEQVIVGKTDNCGRYREWWETTELWGETELCDGQRIAGNSIDLWERLGIMGKIGNCGRHREW